MELIHFLIIILVAWLLYSILASYNNMASELREIRLKCINNGGNLNLDQPPSPINSMKDSVINQLQNVISYIK
jgi:hypothetical protein